MRILADTHVIYWAMTRPGELAASARMILENPLNDVLVSAASIWELEIKSKKNKLYLPAGFTEGYKADAFDELPVTWAHAQETSKLPPIHNDPFDRILIAQARVEGLILMTRDHLIRQYDVPTADC